MYTFFFLTVKQQQNQHLLYYSNGKKKLAHFVCIPTLKVIFNCIVLKTDRDGEYMYIHG